MAKRKVYQKPRAKSDLIETWRYLAERSPNAADKFLDRVEEVSAMLALYPLAGRERPELEMGLRSFPMETHVIFYIPSSDRIDIVRVLSGNRDLESIEFDA